MRKHPLELENPREERPRHHGPPPFWRRRLIKDLRSLPPVVSWVAHRSVPSHIQNAGQRDLHKPQEADYE
jgi:hypothetical protein